MRKYYHLALPMGNAVSRNQGNFPGDACQSAPLCGLLAILVTGSPIRRSGQSALRLWENHGVPRKGVIKPPCTLK